MKKLLDQLVGFFPHRLPMGATALEEFCRKIFDTYSVPDMPSYRQAIASMIMHLPQTVYHKAPWFFACSVRKAMANQVAYEMIDQLRQDEKKAQEALKNITEVQSEVNLTDPVVG